MIINMRGANGSGKTYLARRLMELYDVRKPVLVEGRRQPIWYVLRRRGSQRRLIVIGHYESASGGCDFLPPGICSRIPHYRPFSDKEPVLRSIWTRLGTWFPGCFLILLLLDPVHTGREEAEERGLDPPNVASDGLRPHLSAEEAAIEKPVVNGQKVYQFERRKLYHFQRRKVYHPGGSV